MGKKFDVVAAVGKYPDGNGGEKTKYMNCGVVIEKEGRLSMKLEGLPVAGTDWNGWLSFFEPRERQQQGGQQQAPAKNNDPFADESGF